MDIPDEFVAPARSSRSTKTRSKHHAHSEKSHGPSAPSRVYSKRATGTTVSSDNTGSKRVVGSSGAMPSIKTRHATSASPPAPAPEPVDFVYDVRMRSRLREGIDRKRSEVREAALAREVQLRAEHKWVADSSDSDKLARAPRREAWASDLSAQTQPASSSCSHRTGAQAPSSRSSSASTRRMTAASSSVGGKKSKQSPLSSSIGPHVSDWQYQTAPRFSASRQTLEHQRKTQQQQREREH